VDATACHSPPLADTANSDNQLRLRVGGPFKKAPEYRACSKIQSRGPPPDPDAKVVPIRG
jgi:hypothetical protein